MRSAGFYFVLLAACFSCASPSKQPSASGSEDSLWDAVIADDKADYGGADISITQVPWQVSVQEPSVVREDGTIVSWAHTCGGIILSPDWVLSAQHCFQPMVKTRIVAGVTNLSEAESGQSRVVDRMELPSAPWNRNYYALSAYSNDVALLHLAQPLDLSGPAAQAVSIFEDTSFLQPGDVGITSGWGATSSSVARPDHLQAVGLDLVLREDVRRRLRHAVPRDQLFGWTLDKSVCHGDSGGPFVVKKVEATGLAGVVSWGPGVCGSDVPSAFTRTDLHLEWIREHVSDVKTIALEPSSGASNPAD